VFPPKTSQVQIQSGVQYVYGGYDMYTYVEFSQIVALRGSLIPQKLGSHTPIWCLAWPSQTPNWYMRPTNKIMTKLDTKLVYETPLLRSWPSQTPNWCMKATNKVMVKLDTELVHEAPFFVGQETPSVHPFDY
jgi:hypothetical protein